MVEKGIARSATDYAIYDPADANAGRVVGRLVARGLSDELNDRHYLIVDGVDGRTHYADIGRGDATEAIPEGAVVALQPKPVGPRQVDRTVAEIAAANGGRYNVDIHLRHDSTAKADFAETHVGRPGALRRLRRPAHRAPASTWTHPHTNGRRP